jgi:hypothetical protein
MTVPVRRQGSSTLVFRVPEWSKLGMQEAKNRVLMVLQSLPGVSVKRVTIAPQAREIYIDADFPLRGYQYVRNRFKTEIGIGTPLLTIRNAHEVRHSTLSENPLIRPAR